MPFKKTTNEVSWVEPKDDDVRKVRDDILNSGKVVDVEIPVTKDLHDKLKDVLSTRFDNRYIRHKPNSTFYNNLSTILTQPKSGACDIILPVHNGLQIVKPCIEALYKRTNWPFNLLIVDDASDERTHDYLCEVAMSNKSNTSLLTNTKNRQFAATVNRGLRETNSPYVCLLNSDVLVTDNWLTKMVLALESDKRNQIVNPCTNSTAMINVPMSPGFSYLEMNRIFEEFSERRYPEINPTGFCFMFRRELVNKIGLMDEAYVSYGEETDFWMRALTYIENDNYVRYQAVLADDTYVYHERGSSFAAIGANAAGGLRTAGNARFKAIWPQYAEWAKFYDVKAALGALRQHIPIDLTNKVKKDYRICWVVYSSEFCGGMKFISDIVNEINERGGDARVAVIQRDSSKQVNQLGELRTGVTVFENEDDFLNNFHTRVFTKGVVVASTVEASPTVATVCQQFPKLQALLHAQSYEPELTDDPKALSWIDEAYPQIPDAISSSGWVTKELEARGLNVIDTICPGVDHNLFYPRGREKGDDRFTILIPLISRYAFKGYQRGVALIQQLWNQSIKEGLDIRIMCYGVDHLPDAYGTVTALGGLSQPRLAKLLGTEVDLFVDPSLVHSYGMPCLEAMASRVPVLTWDNKGIREYLKHGKSGVLARNSTSPAEMAKNIIGLIKDSKRVKIAKEGHKASLRHDRTANVSKFIASLENHYGFGRPRKRIVVATPHLRKHGGPTTIIQTANALAAKGHDVSMVTVYPDINPEVVKTTSLDISVNAKEFPECDILISNSDNPFNEYFVDSPRAKKKVMLKLSHNPRFKKLENDSLKLNWDGIVTSSQWLADVTKNPLSDWDHPSQDATRIGWYHYGHELFSSHPSQRPYGQGTPESPIKIATLVHAHPSKGTDEAAKALRVIKERFGDNVYLVAIGEIPKSALDQYRLFQFYGPSMGRKNMAQVMKQTDLWVGASQTEGLGRMALEAMSAGAACVLTDTGAEFAEHGKNCLLSPVGDVDQMIEHITQLIDKPETRAKVALAGHETAVLCADPVQYTENLEKFIEGLFDAS